MFFHSPIIGIFCRRALFLLSSSYSLSLSIRAAIEKLELLLLCTAEAAATCCSTLTAAAAVAAAAAASGAAAEDGGEDGGESPAAGAGESAAAVVAAEMLGDIMSAAMVMNVSEFLVIGSYDMQEYVPSLTTRIH